LRCWQCQLEINSVEVVADAVGRLVANGVCGRIKEAQTKLEINIFELEQTNISTTHIACVSGCTA